GSAKETFGCALDLRSDRTEARAVSHTGPRQRGLGHAPTQSSHRGLCIRNAVEPENTVLAEARDAPVRSFCSCHKRLVHSRSVPLQCQPNSQSALTMVTISARKHSSCY